MARCEVTLGRAELGRFGALLQQGIAVRARARSLAGFLVEDLGLARDYVRNRITTVFLDGEVVDDLEAATLRDGSRLALSAAMPGLVGATLRRGGPYAAMRAEITRARAQRQDAAAGGAVIQVKLFNMLIAEVGPVLLERGVLLERAVLAALDLGVAAGPGAPGELVEVRVRLHDGERGP